MSRADGHRPVRTILEAADLADAYFMKKGPVHETARALARILTDEGIEFAVAGALAVNAHGLLRMTEDVDVLITREGLERFKARWVGRGYLDLRPGGKPVRDTQTKVKIDFLFTGEFPGDGKPKPVKFPAPSDASTTVGTEPYPVLTLPKLIELKLASAMTTVDRPRDFDDVIRLIRVQKLPREFASLLDPYVRAKFDEMWNAAQQNPDDY